METKSKMGKAQLGEKNHMFGKHIPEEKKKSHGSPGKKHPFWGEKRPPEVLQKISISRKINKVAKGDKNPNWKGGITKIKYSIRTSQEYLEWRKKIYMRDYYTCQWCGDNKSGNLNADHIKPFAVILDENNIKTLEEAILCDELWDIANGRTLCVPCHKKTDTYGNKTITVVPC